MDTEYHENEGDEVTALEAALERKCDDCLPKYGAYQERAEQAEAALAERDRMLRLAVGDGWVSNGWNRADAEDDPGFAGEIDALRARAEDA